jgi:hypothetical protein
MRHLLKTIGLLLLLIVAQQGAAVHELTHVTDSRTAAVRLDKSGAADTTCALCPAFAQVATPAFTHSFPVPRLGRATYEQASEPRHPTVEGRIPRPRSRGPPSFS